MIGVSKVSIFFGFILLVLLICPIVTAYDDRAVQYYNEGNNFFKLGKYSEAVASYDKAIAINPNKANTWYNRGIALYNLGRYTEAVASYDKAIAIKPDYADAANNRKIALQKLSQGQSTPTPVPPTLTPPGGSNAPHISTWFEGSWFEGISTWFKGSWFEGISTWFKGSWFLGFNPAYTGTTSAANWFNKGSALYNQGEYQKAVDAYNNALSIDPNDKDAWLNKGIALFRLGEYQEALDASNKALSIDPNNKAAWNMKGIALEHLGEYQKAVDAYNNALSIDPNYQGVWVNKGMALEKLGRHQEAQDALNKAKALTAIPTVQPNSQPLSSGQTVTCPTRMTPPCHSVQNGREMDGGPVPASCNCPSDTTWEGYMDRIAPGGPYKICTCK
jgi:tetratricopeptide (TPR) repeat protein